MGQMLGLLQLWFESKSQNKGSVSIRQTGELILEKGIANDIDSAIKIVFSQLKIPEDRGDTIPLSNDDFKRIFIVSILKTSFL